jgi:hypothetical protein
VALAFDGITEGEKIIDVQLCPALPDGRVWVGDGDSEIVAWIS